jgi:hypothetical protein
MFKTVTALALRLVRQKTRRNASFIVAPPCQSDIKRTLRRAGPAAKTLFSRRFRTPSSRSFDPDGERTVSGAGGLMVSKWWMRQMLRCYCEPAINRKFTPNQISHVFRRISAN